MTEEPNERFARGVATAIELFSGSPTLPSFPVPDEIEDDWSRFSVSTVMGDVWSRPGLDALQRAMITIALLTASDKPEQLRAYISIGLNQGVTRSQVCEVILHTAAYAGFPAAIEGLRVAEEVFGEYDAATDPKTT